MLISRKWRTLQETNAIDIKETRPFVFGFWRLFIAVHFFPRSLEKQGCDRRWHWIFSSNFLPVRDSLPESCMPDGIRETVESEGSCRWRRWGVASKSRRGVRERKRAPATGAAGLELLQILNISDHQSPSAWQYPKVLALHLFLYRASIYERRTSLRRARLRSSLDNTWWFASYFTPYRW